MIKKVFLCIIISIFISGCAKQIKKEEVILKVNQKQKQELKGADKIEDVKLREKILKFLNGSLTVEEEYYYYSKSFLKKWYPNIKNVEEYKESMKGAEKEPVKEINLEITEFGKISENKVYFDLVSLAADAPGSDDMDKVKERYIFVREDGIWKFDGMDTSIYEVIEQ